MTAPEIERTEPGPARRTSTKSAGRAYQRRSRREQAHRGRNLTRTGSPIAAALSRVPFVATVILLLAGGIVGVLWLNTLSDAAGLSASQSRIKQQDLTNRIESVGKDIAALKNPALLAAQAGSLGLVPPGDAAILSVGKDGNVVVIGSPTPVAGPPAPPAAAPAPVTTAPAVPPAPATTSAAAATKAAAVTKAAAATKTAVTTRAAAVAKAATTTRAATSAAAKPAAPVIKPAAPATKAAATKVPRTPTTTTTTGARP